MTLLQKILLCIWIFLQAGADLGWFGTNPSFVGWVGMGFVIVVFVEYFLGRISEK